jgi:hypothetical protein
MGGDESCGDGEVQWTRSSVVLENMVAVVVVHFVVCDTIISS